MENKSFTDVSNINLNAHPPKKVNDAICSFFPEGHCPKELLEGVPVGLIAHI